MEWAARDTLKVCDVIVRHVSVVPDKLKDCDTVCHGWVVPDIMEHCGQAVQKEVFLFLDIHGLCLLCNICVQQ
jgi:hypothetical protein